MIIKGLKIIWVVAFQVTGGAKRRPHNSPSKHGALTECCLMSGQRRRRWANIEKKIG